jgi:4-hydroxy-2-oxoheptanedioate aldolase
MLRAQRRETFRQVLTQTDTRLVGTFCIIPRIEIIEIAALAGFDLVAVDWEHGPFGPESTMPLVVAAQKLGIYVLVRVPERRLELVGAAMDLGVDGVIVPHVDTAQRAVEAAAAARFPPEGERSANPWVRAAAFSGATSYLAAANRDVACIATIEGSSGVRESAQIVSTPGIDAIFIGPVDLSASLGVPGQVDHPKVEQTIERLISAAADRSVGVSIFAPTPAAAHRWLSRGARLALLSVDTALALDGFRSSLEELTRLSAAGVAT